MKNSIKKFINYFKKYFIKALKVVSWLFFSWYVSVAAAATSSLNKFIVFGDSLSDTGNLYEYMKHQLPLSPPYYEGRFCNGPLWIELLTAMYYPNDKSVDPQHGQEHLFDYAFGGAGVSLDEEEDEDTLFTLDKEIDSYLLAHQDHADAESMYVIWIGSNNYLALPDDIPQTVTSVNKNILKNIEKLVQKGAKHFLLVNLPDLGITPTARDFNIIDTLSTSSKMHNDLFYKNYEQLQANYPQVQFLYLDVFRLLNQMLEEPQKNGFTNVTDTCYEEMIHQFSPRTLLNMVATVQPHTQANSQSGACEGYLFFDPVHPGREAHRILAENARMILDKAQVTFK